MYISKYFIGSNRLLCIVIIGLLGVALINSFFLKEKNSHYITVDFSPPIEHVSFGIIEANLSDITSGVDNNLILDAKSESSLSKAEISLLLNTSDKTLARVQFLITKTFIGERGRKLSSLFVKYHQYKKAERNYNAEIKDDMSIAQEYSQLDRREYLQNKYLGVGIAQKLYEQQNTFARLLLKMRVIENNTDISDKEKEAEILRLQEEINLLMQRTS